MLTFTIGALATNSPPEFLVEQELQKNLHGIWAFRSIAGDVEFFIDGKLALADPHCNVGELAMQLADWLKTDLHTDFYYDCMNADERGLFTFKRCGNAFKFYSEWKEEDVPRDIRRETLIEFVSQFRTIVNNRIRTELGFNVDYYLNV